MRRDPLFWWLAFCGGVITLCAVTLAVQHIVKVVRQVRTLVSQAKDESPTDPVDAQLDTAPREDDAGRSHAAARIRSRIAVYNPVAEESPFLREIYAAQSLYRDGVDVTKGAPKERL